MSITLTKTILTLLLILTGCSVSAQDHPLSAFENLMGKTWVVEGTWGNGTKYKKETVFEFAFSKTLVVEKSDGFTDSLQTQFGPRNYGVRQFNPSDSSIRFYEYDVFGGLTQGEVIVEDQDIRYKYEYGGYTLMDIWMYESEDRYRYVVTEFKDGAISEQYLLDGTAIAKPAKE